MAGGKRESKLYTHTEEISASLTQAKNLATTAVLSVSISLFILSFFILDPLLSITHNTRADFIA